MINFHERKHDIEGRNILRKICIGRGLDVGSADRPITKDVTTVDKDITIHPNIVADMSNIPLDDCTQNFIISSHSLEHTDNTIDTLREWYRLLKVGGKLGIMVPHGEYVDSEDTMCTIDEITSSIESALGELKDESEASEKE